MDRLFRVGQIVPSSNTTMETEIPAMLRAREGVRPERYTFHSSRMRMHKVVKEELAAMNRQGPRCALELADARVDVMSTACLVAIMAMGPGYHRTVEEDLRAAAIEAGLAAPRVMTSAGALVEGLKTLGADRVALLAPYSDALTKCVVDYIEAEGIEVVDAVNFRIEDNLEVARRDPMRLLEDMQRLNIAQAQCVVLSACVQMQSLAAIHLAQERLGLPVVSTAVCTVRRMLELLEHEPVVPNAGALLGDRVGLDGAAKRLERVQ